MYKFIKQLFCKHIRGDEMYDIKTGKEFELSQHACNLVARGYKFPYLRFKCIKCSKLIW